MEKHVNFTTIMVQHRFVVFDPTKESKSNPMIKVTLEVSSKVNLGLVRYEKNTFNPLPPLLQTL